VTDRIVLTLNSGSSSLKFSVYDMGPEKLLLRGKLERIGSNQGHFEAAGAKEADQSVPLPDHRAALDLLWKWLDSSRVGAIAAVGHRIVQGGPLHILPEIVTPPLLDELRAITPLDPPHLPAALLALEAARKDIPQVACFDTAFHRDLPSVAQRLPLPRALTEGTGLRRYGFHGLSYEYITAELAGAAGGKLIIAHLGNGASMAAVRDGKSVDTTMGFTPAGGLVMGSRPGDLDPGVPAYLLREGKVSLENLTGFIFQECGLKGVSGVSSDLRDLLAAREKDARAQEALDLFCYQARKTLGSLVAALDGVETLVFTGGIGENAPWVRAAICEGMHHLSLRLDASRNGQNEKIISSPASRVIVRVMKTNEEIVIARHTARLVFP